MNNLFLMIQDECQETLSVFQSLCDGFVERIHSDSIGRRVGAPFVFVKNVLMLSWFAMIQSVFLVSVVSADYLKQKVR